MLSYIHTKTDQCYRHSKKKTIEIMECSVVLLFLLLSGSLPLTSAILRGNETDGLALLAIKDRITKDPVGVLNSWNDTIHYCEWVGVVCGRKHPQRVTALHLGSMDLAGIISPSVANLSFLKELNLSSNGFYGEIPPDIGRLQRLKNLDLTLNSLHGGVPMNLTQSSNLEILYLGGNPLTGRIPKELGGLSKLRQLDLSNNSLVGIIPTSLGNLSSLIELSLISNQLEGSIPVSLANLPNLGFFQVSSNRLSGMVPTPLFNLSSLYFLAVASNNLQGSLPSDMVTNLPNLQILYLDYNQFSGPIPSSLSNASKLSEIALCNNGFSGEVPSNLGKLGNLSYLDLESNQLEANGTNIWEFLSSLTNCSQLQFLILARNNLSGVLPSSVANLSTRLQQLEMGGNQISGIIPSGIQNLVNLVELTIENNLLTGIIPEGIGKLKGLQRLNLHTNRLVGNIPSPLGNLSQLLYLYISQNNFTGHIPSSLGNLQHLLRLELGYNELNGNIPKEIFIGSLIVLDVSNNALVGPLPTEVGLMKNLNELYIAANKLSGEIPSSLGNCEVLEVLLMNQNLFQGRIPPSFGEMRSLQVLNLSQNNLSGPILESLQKLNLVYLNISFNHLDGEVPIVGIFRNATAISLIGNDQLCGGIPELQLPPCPIKSDGKGRVHGLLVKIMIPLVVIFMIFIFTFVCLQRKRKQSSATSSVNYSEDPISIVSYAQLVKATDGFSPANLIGMGRYGTVYRGSLDHESSFVAIKVFNLQQQGASKSFTAECESLRNIRHRNLIRILTSCSSADAKGKDFKALIFDLMPNGSLETWLHGKEDVEHGFNGLNLIQRLNIAKDVADALSYLHHDCQPPVVHCDLKPSNVLLDDDMIAHVGDFGLSKFLGDAMGKSLQDSSISIGVRGTIGYIPPEYGAGGQVSTSGDVYSYGILLLEMFTGKRPTDATFGNGLNLCRYVEMGVSAARVMEVVDPLLRSQDKVSIQASDEARNREILVSLLKVGLSCSNESPRERMDMRDVARNIHAFREAYLRVDVTSHKIVF